MAEKDQTGTVTPEAVSGTNVVPDPESEKIAERHDKQDAAKKEDLEGGEVLIRKAYKDEAGTSFGYGDKVAEDSGDTTGSQLDPDHEPSFDYAKPPKNPQV